MTLSDLVEHSHIFIYFVGIIFAAGGFVLLTRKNTDEARKNNELTNIKIDKAMTKMECFQTNVADKMDDVKNSLHSMQLENTKTSIHVINIQERLTAIERGKKQE